MQLKPERPPTESTSQEEVPVSVVMLTLNEERNLPGAIDSVADWAHDIFILDSLSSDRTIDIALERGVKIAQRPFADFGDQWNFALKKLPITTEWTFKLDPDERFTEGLRDEIRELIQTNPTCCGYSMDRRLWFMGKPLHVRPAVLRLWRTGKCRFSDVIVNEHPIIDGPVGKLKGILEHVDTPDLHLWWDKQNRYSTMEAIMRVKGDPLAATPKLLGTPLERRMFMKNLFFRLPFRYPVLWLHEFFLRGAWFDGRLGLEWARLRVEFTRMIELKAKEMQTTGRIPEIPKAEHGDFDPRILSSSLQQDVVGPKSQPGE